MLVTGRKRQITSLYYYYTIQLYHSTTLPLYYSTQVAVKVLEKSRMRLADEIERVGREIQILKLLRHPHVVRLWEIARTSGGRGAKTARWNALS